MSISGLTEENITVTIGDRLARHRLNREWTQKKLAKEAGVSIQTVHRLENGQSLQLDKFLRLLRALDLLENLNAFIPEPASSPLQQVKLQGRERKRASTARRVPKQTEWSWGDDT